MSEAAVAEETTTEISQVSTPVSTETPALVTEEVTAAPATQGTETPDAGAEVKPPESYTRAELDDMYGKGKLTDPTLVSRRESLLQAERDRQRFEADQLAQRQAAEQASRQARREASTRLKADVDNINAQFDEHGGPPALREQLIANRMLAYEAEIATATEVEHKQGHRDAILRLEGEVTLKRRTELDAMTLPQLAEELFTVAYKKGQTAGAPDGYVLKKASEWEAELKAAVDDYKAKNPGPGLPSTNGVTAHAVDKHPRNMSDAEYAAWHDRTTEAERAKAWAAP